MSNKAALTTILGTALLGLAKAKNGSKNDGITITNREDLIRYSQDPQLAKTVTKVDLYEGELTSFPESIGNLVNLEGLFLSGRNLSSLPESIGNLVNLRVLHLFDNDLSSLPDSIGNLVNLKFLNLNRNNLSSIPESIGNLVNLCTLDLTSNNLSSIPESIGNLVNLEHLYLDRNNLTSLPDSIGNLVNLHSFYLDSNNLGGPSRTFVLRGLLSGTFSPKVAEKIMPYLSDSPRNKIRSF